MELKTDFHDITKAIRQTVTGLFVGIIKKLHRLNWSLHMGQNSAARLYEFLPVKDQQELQAERKDKAL